jgi:hypothetical protein
LSVASQRPSVPAFVVITCVSNTGGYLSTCSTLTEYSSPAVVAGRSAVPLFDRLGDGRLTHGAILRQGHAHLSARLRPPPNLDRLLQLEDQVVADDSSETERVVGVTRANESLKKKRN